MGWLFLQPAAWRNYVHQIDPVLRPNFCLAELTHNHWRNPALQRLMLIGYLLWPCCIGISLSIMAWLFHWLEPFALFGWAMGTSLGMVLGMVISAAVGIPVLIFTGALFGVVWGAPNLIMFDVVNSMRYALVFGLTSALVVGITGNITQTSVNASLTRQAGSFVLGFVASLLAATGVAAGLLVLVQWLQANLVASYAIPLIVGGVPAVPLGLAVGWRTRKWRRGVIVGLCLCLYVAALFGNQGSGNDKNPGGEELIASYGVLATFVYVTLLVFPYVLVEPLIGSWIGAIAGAFGSLAIHPINGYLISLYATRLNLIWGISFVVSGVTLPWWRPLLFYPLEAAWATLLLRRTEQSPTQAVRYLRWHAVFWDEQQFLPLSGLDEQLVLVIKQNPSEGQLALNSVGSSRQRWAAQAAQIELDAQRLEQCTNVAEIALVNTQLGDGVLEGPANALLRSFSLRSRDTEAALAQLSTYNQRLALSAVEDDLNLLLRELTRSSEPYAQRFRPVVNHWQQIVTQRIKALGEEAELRQEIQNPYIVGVPLTKHQEIFVGRTDTSARIEQLLQDQDYPPLLLYGQRRMGKTSLLRHLRWLLPNRIVPLFVDLQGPVAQSTHHASFLYNVAKAMFNATQEQNLAIGQLTREKLADDPFTVFDDWLDEIETALVISGRSTILLALDEFEALDSALTMGQFSEQAILGGLRHIIQHRPRFKLLLAGSHTLDEFRRWSSYLINAQLVHLSYLHENETRQLIERPIQNFALSYTLEASQRVLAITRGHPYLVQLLCSEIVTLKNEQEAHLRRRATFQDVEAAVPEMLVRGSQFFADIELNQVSADGLHLLRYLAKLGEGHQTNFVQLNHEMPDTTQLHQTLTLLIQRELLENINGAYRFQVEAIRRWFTR